MTRGCLAEQQRMTFTLDPRLEADTVDVVDLDLSSVRLMNDQRFPWLIVVPRFADLVEVTDLSHGDRYRLIDNVAHCSDVLQSVIPDTHKINVGALGNMVSQLHVHVIARRTSDAAWPNPVWGVGSAEPYEAQVRAQLVDTLRAKFARTA